MSCSLCKILRLQEGWYGLFDKQQALLVKIFVLRLTSLQSSCTCTLVMTASRNVISRPGLTSECAMQQLGTSEEAEEAQPIS